MVLRRLLDAVLMIGSDVELPALLKHIVAEACSLVGARYGAARRAEHGEDRARGVPDVRDDRRRRSGDRNRPNWTRGPRRAHHRARAVRLSNISAHPDSYGFRPATRR